VPYLQLAKVVDFTIRTNRILGILIDNGLFSAFGVHDGEPLVGKTELFISVIARAIGATRAERSRINDSRLSANTPGKWVWFSDIYRAKTPENEIQLAYSDAGASIVSSPSQRSRAITRFRVFLTFWVIAGEDRAHFRLETEPKSTGTQLRRLVPGFIIKNTRCLKRV
jgi:hypothetical protein